MASTSGIDLIISSIPKANNQSQQTTVNPSSQFKMKLATITTIAIGMIAATEATRVQMCKKTGKKDCVPVDCNWTICTNLKSGDGRPFVSGWSEGSTCDIYSEPGCTGIGNTVDKKGWNRFPFHVKSIRC